MARIARCDNCHAETPLTGVHDELPSAWYQLRTGNWKTTWHLCSAKCLAAVTEKEVGEAGALPAGSLMDRVTVHP